MRARKSKRYTVIVQEWEESERGWGVRPDGASLHLTETDRKAYCEDFWKREKKSNPGGEVPDEYTRESGGPKTMEVDETVYQKIKKSKHGITLWQTEYREMRQKLLN
jgi:hypothetical protein